MLLEYPMVQPGPTQERITWRELLLAQMVKNQPANAGDTASTPEKDPLEKATPVFSPGKSHGQRSLVGYSPCGYTELDMTERLNNNKARKKASSYSCLSPT